MGKECFGEFPGLCGRRDSLQAPRHDFGYPFIPDCELPAANLQQPPCGNLAVFLDFDFLGLYKQTDFMSKVLSHPLKGLIPHEPTR